MGRMYYASSKRPEPSNDRLIHVLTTNKGTVVLAMRPPEQGERGFAIGVDFTVMQAVKEMLSDWDPSEGGPGWMQGPHKTSDFEISEGADQTYDVTILAAFELSAHQHEHDEEAPSENEAADFVRQEEAIRAIREIAESDFRNLDRRPEWSAVCEIWGDDRPVAEARETLGDARAKWQYNARFDELAAANQPETTP